MPRTVAEQAALPGREGAPQIFDERFAVHEEPDLAHRVEAIGRSVVSVPELRVTHEIGIQHQVKPALELFKNLGYSHLRSYYTMHIALDAPPPIPSWAPGIALRPFVPERDMEAVYRADVEAFSDHWGYIVQPFEIGYPRFVHHFTETENYDPTLWFIAWDGDEVANGWNPLDPNDPPPP